MFLLPRCILGIFGVYGALSNINDPVGGLFLGVF